MISWSKVHNWCWKWLDIYWGRFSVWWDQHSWSPNPSLNGCGDSGPDHSLECTWMKAVMLIKTKTGREFPQLWEIPIPKSPSPVPNRKVQMVNPGRRGLHSKFSNGLGFSFGSSVKVHAGQIKWPYFETDAHSFRGAFRKKFGFSWDFVLTILFFLKLERFWADKECVSCF